MNKYTAQLAIFLLVGLLAGISQASGEEVQTLSLKNFSMQYPAAGWEKDVDEIQDTKHMLRLHCTRIKQSMDLLITLIPDAPPPDLFYQQTPSLVGLSHSYSIIKNYLEEGESDNVIITFGEVQLQDGPAASAQVSGKAAGGKNHVTVHSFALIKNSMLLMGALLTSAPVGQIIEDPEYHAAIKEAYSIIRSMKIQ